MFLMRSCCFEATQIRCAADSWCGVGVAGEATLNDGGAVQRHCGDADAVAACECDGVPTCGAGAGCRIQCRVNEMSTHTCSAHWTRSYRFGGRRLLAGRDDPVRDVIDDIVGEGIPDAANKTCALGCDALDAAECFSPQHDGGPLHPIRGEVGCRP